VATTRRLVDGERFAGVFLTREAAEVDASVSTPP
jgi:hypothetical protein